MQVSNFWFKNKQKGLVRLLERDVLIKCREEDVQLMQELIPDAKKSFNEFLKKETGKDVQIELNVFDGHYLTKDESE